jgi:hypothetical protein
VTAGSVVSISAGGGVMPLPFVVSALPRAGGNQPGRDFVRHV